MGGRWRRLADYARWRLAGRPVGSPVPGYDAWIAAYAGIRPPAAPLLEGPRLSIICPVRDPRPEHFEAMVSSVLAQTYERWQLALVDDASVEPAVMALLDEIGGHPNVSVVHSNEPLGIVGASNRALEEVDGELVAFVDHDDVLAPEALEWMAAAATEADLIYSDDDQMLADGTRTLPFFKPAWSPRLLLGMNYLSHLVAVRTSLLRDLGGLREGTSGAQDHDLALRISERSNAVVHVPAQLYHWRQAPGSVAADADAKPWAAAAATAVVQAALDRRGWEATAQPTGQPFRFRVEFHDAPGRVAVATQHTTAEIDRAVADSDGDIIVLAPGLQLVQAEAHQLAGWLGDADVSAVGGMVVDGSGRIVSCGWITDEKGGYAYAGGRPTTPRPFVEVAREVSQLDGLCLAVRVADYRDCGGLTHDLPPRQAAFDLARRLGRRGRLVVDPTVVVIAPRGVDSISAPVANRPDPYASPHLGLPDGMTISTPPKVASSRLARLAPRPAPNLD